ncbi:MAG: glycosyltransferase family 4 protein, partial [bacterium]|nr:glycosyltransferase family 4 protein [bacterium]
AMNHHWDYPDIWPTVVRCHSYEVFQPEFVRIEWGKVDAVLFGSDHVLDYAKTERGFDHPNVHVIPLGFDLEHYQPPPDKVYGKVIGFVGSLNLKKGPMLLAQVIKAVTDYDPEFQFRLCGHPGDPRFVAYFWHMLETWGIRDNVTNLGYLDDMRAFYHGCDYILSTSPWEGNAQCVGEGIACGCIPLVHAWRGAAELYPYASTFGWPSMAKTWIEAGDQALWLPDSRADLPDQNDCLDRIGAVIEEVVG